MHRERPRSGPAPPSISSRSGPVLLAVPNPGIAPLQRLMQRRVVIPGGDAGDVEAPVFLLQRPFGPEDHAGGDRALAGRMADVEALDPLRAPRQDPAPRPAPPSSRRHCAAAPGACAAPGPRSPAPVSTQRAAMPRTGLRTADRMPARSRSTSPMASLSASARPSSTSAGGSCAGVVLQDEGPQGLIRIGERRAREDSWSCPDCGRRAPASR